MRATIPLVLPFASLVVGCDPGEVDCDTGVPDCDQVDLDGDQWTEAEGDCDDLDPAVHPGAPEWCNGVDDDCDGQLSPGEDEDADLDGFLACDDCDDHDDGSYPGAEEVCDGADNDCDGVVPDLELLDQDDDGFVYCADCDDTESTTYPGAMEYCGDELDNDCDEATDAEDDECAATMFAIVGDSRGDDNGINEPILTEIVDEIIAQGATFLLFPGDLVTGSSTEDTLRSQLTTWRTVAQPLYDAGITVLPVRGNHDTGSLDAWNDVFSGAYALPPNSPPGQENLSFATTLGDILVVGLDSYVDDGRVDVAWLAGQLAAREARHALVFAHEPAFQAQHTDCLDDHPSSRDALWSVLRAHGARAWFCGHDHFYDHARILDGDPAADLHQFIVGTAGAPLRSWTPSYDGENGEAIPIPVHHDTEYGYLLGEVRGDLLTLVWWHRDDGVYVETDEVFSYSAPPTRPGRLLTHQQGVDGYLGTVDTYLAEDHSTLDLSEATELYVDSYDPGQVQALLHFEGLFDAGVDIRWAALRFKTIDGGDGADLHRMLTGWADTDTWDSFDPHGVVADGVEAEAEPDVSTYPIYSGVGFVDVTRSLQSWAAEPDPELANLGWALLPLGSDGWDFYSAEGAEPPTLLVVHEGD